MAIRAYNQVTYKVLYKAGAKSVDCLCLARGLVYKFEKDK